MSASTADGEPLRQVAQRCGIHLGTAVRAAAIRDSSTYRDLVASHFDQLAPESELKWMHVRPARAQFCLDDADRLVDFALAQGMRMRGQSLVWPRFVPPWLQDGHVSAAQVEDILREHIETMVGRYRGRVHVWDVVNEAYGWDGCPIAALIATARAAATSNARNVWFDPGVGTPGIGYVDTAFRLARAADAGARLFYNDYGLEKRGPKFDAVHAMAARLRRDGAPIDGIGIQMHAALSEYYDCVAQPQPVPAFDLSTFVANLEQLASLGLDVEITELDVRLPLPANPALRTAQAELYGAIVAACMRQPRCTAVQLWGFTDRHSWLPQFQHRYPGEGEAHPFDADYAAKPAVAAIRAAMIANAR